jgi:hypothetical protein
MQNNATIQQKAMQDIFALDEAVGQFESFGSQLDLGLPTEEDDAPKSFDDMLEVNPSNEPMEFGENFMSEGDDMADKQTQKFVVDEFAKEAAKLPDGNISAADITGISAIIQMNNHITGDVRSFIDQTINHAVQAQQQQNVSDAQPNGTVAQDIAKTGDNAGADVGAEAPIDGGIPTMDPVDPTAEPSLETNPADGLDASMTADVGDPLADMTDPLAADPAAAPAAEEDPLADMTDPLAADPAAAPAAEEDPLAGMDAGLEGDAPAADAGEPAAAEGDADLDGFLDDDGDASASADEGKVADDKSDDKSEDKSEDKSDDKSESKDDDNDEDFNFEAIATKARGLMEDQTAAEVPVDASAVDAGSEQGANAAVEDVGGDTASTDEPAMECGAAAADDAEARVESIVSDTRMKMAVAQAKAVLESYHQERERSNTLAKLDSVVSNLKQKVLTESIVADYGKKSKERAQLESAVEAIYNEPEATPAPSVFEATMDRINSALSAKKPSIAAEADKVIAEFEASQAAAKKALNESVEAPKADPKQARIDSLLEGAAHAAAATSDIDQQLKDIVNQVKNS